jgi:hypothetical protein
MIGLTRRYGATKQKGKPTGHDPTKLSLKMPHNPSHQIISGLA